MNKIKYMKLTWNEWLIKWIQWLFSFSLISEMVNLILAVVALSILVQIVWIIFFDLWHFSGEDWITILFCLSKKIIKFSVYFRIHRAQKNVEQIPLLGPSSRNSSSYYFPLHWVENNITLLCFWPRTYVPRDLLWQYSYYWERQSQASPTAEEGAFDLKYDTCLPRDKESTEPVSDLLHVWKYLPLFQPQHMLLHSVSVCVPLGIWSTPSCICPQQGMNGVESIYQYMRGAHVGKLPSVSCQERLPGHGRSKPKAWLCFCFPWRLWYQYIGLAKIGVLFCRMLWKDANKMFWSTQYNGQKRLESSHMTDNQFMSFCSTLILRQKKLCLGREKKWKRLKITTEGKYPPFFESLHWPRNIAIHFALHIPMLHTLRETDFYHHFAS